MGPEPVRPTRRDRLPHLGPGVDEPQARQRFDRNELAVVLSHYDIGVVRSAKAFPRGSRRAPKVRITTEEQEFLLKRRAAGQDEPTRVAFSHSIQSFLDERSFPVAPLVATQRNSNTLLELDGRIYELFHFVIGRRFDHSANDAWESGVTLGRMHALLESFDTKYHPEATSFHGVKDMRRRINRIPAMIEQVEGVDGRQEMEDCCTYLRRAYRQAVQCTKQLGFDSWSPAFLHGDWHPGNLLFDGPITAAVLDFDSARKEPRVVEIANALLQFSMRMGGSKNISSWPKGLDTSILQSLASGYQASAKTLLTSEECAAIPWLMIEAIIAESVFPIAATGTFGTLTGSEFLGVVEEKVRWIAPRVSSIAQTLESP